MQELGKGVELAGRYALVDRLGSGGAAEIWLAEDRLTRASVALKIRVADRVSEDDFRVEWQTSLRLMHAHIVRVFEFHDDSGLLFYSMQYVDGPEIGVLSGAPLDHVLPPVAAVADALRYAHGKDVVHRDVKPGNVLLDHDGAPFLVDFGVAARRDRIATGGSLIAASPQSLAGAPAQPADDVFALGGLIYELVSGASPYSSSATEDDILQKVPPPLAMADGSPVPGDLQRLVAAMLDKEADSRPDAHGVVDQLAALGASPGAAPAGYAGKTRKAGVDVIEVSRAARPQRSTDAAVPPPEADRRAGLSPRLVGAGLAVLLSILIGVVFFLPDTVEDERAAPSTELSGAPVAGTGDRDTPEDAGALPSRDERVTARAETDAVLGELLAKMETLERRAVQRWAGLKYKQAQAAYAAGDEAYLARDYARATEKYREAIDTVEPLLDQVDLVFKRAYEAGLAALEAADSSEALRQLELSVAISPDHAGALAGLARARNLDTVLALTDQGLAHENDLELEAARRSFADAVDLDPEWQPARAGLERVLETIRQRDFDRRMTEGFAALGEQDYAAARAAFRTAHKLKPESREPADGLLQVDQAVQLNRIAVLQQSAAEQTRAEQWEAAIETYESILEIDPNLSFALQGLDEARRMSALHTQLHDFIENPDSLSAPATMARATRLVVDITRMPEIGPRLADRRDTLSRLLKRAATPLTVHLVSDNQTSVSIYKVGKLGAFETRELELRPGTYVAVGSRPGYRDVRLEFRVGPEMAAGPIVVRCEEKI